MISAIIVTPAIILAVRAVRRCLVVIATAVAGLAAVVVLFITCATKNAAGDGSDHATYSR
ncbi:MAG: hypothetical protein ACI9NC_003402, partial [Verrucomicrobiales bacterium]